MVWWEEHPLPAAVFAEGCGGSLRRVIASPSVQNGMFRAEAAFLTSSIMPSSGGGPPVEVHLDNHENHVVVLTAFIVGEAGGFFTLFSASSAPSDLRSPARSGSAGLRRRGQEHVNRVDWLPGSRRRARRRPWSLRSCASGA